MPDLHLGHRVGSGEPVDLPLHHMAVVGQTRLSGKTTAVEGLLGRLPSGWSALVFRTKRGELGFEGGRRHAPYYKERVDWEYVKAVLEAAMKARMTRIEQSFIIKASRGAASLEAVYNQIKRESSRAFDESVLTNLRAYFEKVLPILRERRWADQLQLQPGLNVMDLTELPEEVQSLIIAACLEELHRNGHRIVIVIPEAWAFIPQGRGNPVKWSAEHVIRQGGANDLWMWLDSQEITSVDKAILKSVGVYLLGRQMEVNEVRRVLNQIPLPLKAKPAPEAVATLRVGHFYAAFGERVHLAYAEPAWLSCDDARAVAMGTLTVEQAHGMRPETRKGNGMAYPPGALGLRVAKFNDDAMEVLNAQVVALRENVHKEEERANKAELALRRSDEALAALEKEHDELKVNLQKADEALLATEREREDVTQFRVGLLRFLGLGSKVIGGVHGSPEQVMELAKLVRQQLVHDGFGQAGTPTVVEVREAVLLDFQRDAAERIMVKARAATPQARMALLWLEATGKPATITDIALAFGITRASGDPYIKFIREFSAFTQSRLALHANKWYESNIAGLVREELARHRAGEEQVRQVVQQVMGELRRE